MEIKETDRHRKMQGSYGLGTRVEWHHLNLSTLLRRAKRGGVSSYQYDVSVSKLSKAVTI